MATMITKEDLKQEIEELDENYLEQVLRLLKQFPHRPKAQAKHNAIIFGVMEGEFSVPDNFDEPLPRQIEDCFYPTTL